MGNDVRIEDYQVTTEYKGYTVTVSADHEGWWIQITDLVYDSGKFGPYLNSPEAFATAQTIIDERTYRED